MPSCRRAPDLRPDFGLVGFPLGTVSLFKILRGDTANWGSASWPPRPRRSPIRSAGLNNRCKIGELRQVLHCPAMGHLHYNTGCDTLNRVSRLKQNALSFGRQRSVCRLNRDRAGSLTSPASRGGARSIVPAPFC